MPRTLNKHFWRWLPRLRTGELMPRVGCVHFSGYGCWHDTEWDHPLLVTPARRRLYSATTSSPWRQAAVAAVNYKQNPFVSVISQLRWITSWTHLWISVFMTSWNNHSLSDLPPLPVRSLVMMSSAGTCYSFSFVLPWGSSRSHHLQLTPHPTSLKHKLLNNHNRSNVTLFSGQKLKDHGYLFWCTVPEVDTW